jgi:hypothetical protein
MDKEKQKLTMEEREEEIIAEQIRESYQSGLIEPEVDNRANNRK